MIIFWPFLMLLKRYESAWKFAIATPQTRFDMKQEMEEDLIASSRAQILEAAIESSFQPILQLYLLLPSLLLQVSYPRNELLKLFSPSCILCTADHCTSRLQFWSVVTSIISLSWSFTYYQAVQKKGALDLGSNPLGRMTLFFSNLLQITSRLFALIFYAYAFGKGNFWPMLLSVAIHVVVMSLLHYLTSDEWMLDTFKGKKIKIFYHCLINGICNIYFHNWIGQRNDSTSESKVIRVKKHGTVFRQSLSDTIFVIENASILTFSYIRLKNYLGSNLLSSDLLYVFIFILVSQYVGILLKIIYYFHFHIWKHTFSCQMAVQNVKESIKACTFKSKSSNIIEQPILMKTKEVNISQIDMTPESEVLVVKENEQNELEEI